LGANGNTGVVGAPFAAPVPGPTVGAGLPSAIFGALGLIWFARQRQQRSRNGEAA
jgi:hypothetical protein